jgi:hypothetical protein
MPAKSRFHRLDAFTKTVEDARIRTTSGGVVTITSLIIILWLVWGEWSDYRKVVVRPELVVDKGRGGYFSLLERTCTKSEMKRHILGGVAKCPIEELYMEECGIEVLRECCTQA